MRRFIVTVFVLIGFAVIATAEAQYCQCRCYRTAHGVQCQRVCSYPQPRYEPAPTYTPQYTYTSNYGGPQLDPALLGLILLGAVVAVVAAIASAASGSNSNDIALIEQSTQAMRTEARDYDTSIAAINQHVAAAERDAFAQGQRDADEEWRRMTHG